MSAPFYVPPEQLIKDRADFARKGIGRGRPIVVTEYGDGVLLIGENASSSLHKVGEIYDRIAFAGVGRFNEFETLRVAGVRYADLKGYSYARTDVTAKGLANAYSQTVGQIFTHEVKPYEVEVIIAEIGDTASDTELFRVQFDGTLVSEEGFSAIGGEEEALRERMADGFDAGRTLGGAIATAAAAVAGTGNGEIDPTTWEAAVLDRALGRRKFRRLEPSEIEAALDGD